MLLHPSRVPLIRLSTFSRLHYTPEHGALVKVGQKNGHGKHFMLET
jgi:hypothetical protein